MPRLDGFDGYHGQKEHGTDLAVAHAAGLWWIGWKATQSTTYVDPTFADIRASWTAFAQRCMYHWLSSITDPLAQAAHYIATVGTFATGEAAMLDAEEAGIAVAKALAWCEAVEDVTHRPTIIYSGLYVAGGTIWNSPELRMSKYGLRPFIVAAYVSEANLRARMTALGSKALDGWQYSSDGPVPGVVGRCDMDQIDNVPAFNLACGIPAPAPSPTEDSDMLRLLAPTDSPARFYAMCDPTGRAESCRWTGDGTDPLVQARLAFYSAATPAGQEFEMALDTGAFINICLDGLLPPGFRADQFANPREIEARMSQGVIDQTARDAAAHANAGVDGIDKRLAAASEALA